MSISEVKPPVLLPWSSSPHYFILGPLHMVRIVFLKWNSDVSLVSTLQWPHATQRKVLWSWLPCFSYHTIQLPSCFHFYLLTGPLLTPGSAYSTVTHLPQRLMLTLPSWNSTRWMDLCPCEASADHPLSDTASPCPTPTGLSVLLTLLCIFFTYTTI